MTLNGVMALILHYFTEFMYDVVVKKFMFAVSSPYEFLVVQHWRHLKLDQGGRPKKMQWDCLKEDLTSFSLMKANYWLTQVHVAVKVLCMSDTAAARE